MKINHFVCLLLLTPTVGLAAASSSSASRAVVSSSSTSKVASEGSVASKSLVVRLKGMLEGANVERNVPTIHDTIDLARRETRTRKTFGQLQKEAQEKGIPLLLVACLFVDRKELFVDRKGFFVDYMNPPLDEFRDLVDGDIKFLLRKIAEKITSVRPHLTTQTFFLKGYPGCVLDGSWLATTINDVPFNEFRSILKVYFGKDKNMDEQYKLALVHDGNNTPEGKFWLNKLAFGPDNPHKKWALSHLAESIAPKKEDKE